MIKKLIDFFFFVFWLFSIITSIYMFYRTSKVVFDFRQLWAFIVFYSLVIVSATIVSFSVIFGTKDSENE